MKLLIMPSSIEEIKKTLNLCDAYLIGIKHLSVNNNMCISIDELDNIFKIIGNKELFINLNKNIENSEINDVKKIMNKLNDYKIKGIFYYDVAIMNIYKKNNFNYDLVWASEHASTNYNTINYWHNQGANYCLISSDITIEETINIKQNSNCKLVVPIFGYQPMFNSKRHIVKNYLEFFNLKIKSKKYYMKKENKIYSIVDNEEGTEVYTNYILNGLSELTNLKNNNIEYVLLNSYNIESNRFIDLLKIIKTNDNSDTINEQVKQIIDNTESGFLYEKTISKVKQNAK